jgi:hypothetical protein
MNMHSATNRLTLSNPATLEPDQKIFRTTDSQYSKVSKHINKPSQSTAPLLAGFFEAILSGTR